MTNPTPVPELTPDELATVERFGIHNDDEGGEVNADNEKLIESVKDLPTITRLSHVTQIEKIIELRDALDYAMRHPLLATVDMNASTVVDTDALEAAEKAHTPPADLIEVAAKAMQERATWPSLHWPNLAAIHHADVARAMAGTALAVFEKAHTPTGDEREALATLLDDLHDDCVTEGGCNFTGWRRGWRPGAPATVNAEVVDPLLSLLRRSEVPEPSAEDEFAPGECTGAGDCDAPVHIHGCYRTHRADQCDSPEEYGHIEPQDEPSDALDLDRLELLARAATPGPWDFIFGGPTQEEDGSWYEPTESGVRSDIWENDFPHADAEFIAATDPQTILALIAALRAASAVTEQGENRHE